MIETKKKTLYHIKNIEDFMREELNNESKKDIENARSPYLIDGRILGLIFGFLLSSCSQQDIADMQMRARQYNQDVARNIAATNDQNTRQIEWQNAREKGQSPFPDTNPNTWYPFAPPSDKVDPKNYKNICTSDKVQTSVNEVVLGLGYIVKTVATYTVDNKGDTDSAKCKLVLTTPMGTQKLFFTTSFTNSYIEFDEPSLKSINEFKEKFKNWEKKPKRPSVI